VCRWGGEEFVVVLPRTPREAAMKIADDILNAIRSIDLQDNNGNHLPITVSVGHVTGNHANCLLREDLIDLADKAMLRAKLLGRDQRIEFGCDF
jgi:diguanylate cyclase (GGDEF)-like protein